MVNFCRFEWFGDSTIFASATDIWIQYVPEFVGFVTVVFDDLICGVFVSPKNTLNGKPQGTQAESESDGMYIYIHIHTHTHR